MSSWTDMQNGNYGTCYDIDYIPVTVCGNWELSFGAYIDEDNFNFEEDAEGGTGSTNIGAVAYLENKDTGAIIRFPFGIDYTILGDIDNPDEFHLYEPDRSLDWGTGITYVIDDVTGMDVNDAEQFIEDNLPEIFDAIVNVVNQNLYKFGYDL